MAGQSNPRRCCCRAFALCQANTVQEDSVCTPCSLCSADYFPPCCLQYWHETIAPVVKSGKNVIIAAHGNSLRALVSIALSGL